jgi:hypothetical protein
MENNNTNTQNEKRFTKGELMLFVGFIVSIFALSLPWSIRDQVYGEEVFKLLGVLASIFGGVLLFLPYIDYELHKISKVSEQNEKRLTAILGISTGICIMIVFLFSIGPILTEGLSSGFIIGIISSIILLLGVSMYNTENDLGLYIPSIKLESPKTQTKTQDDGNKSYKQQENKLGKHEREPPAKQNTEYEENMAIKKYQDSASGTTSHKNTPSQDLDLNNQKNHTETTKNRQNQ